MSGIRYSRLRAEHQRLTWEVEELRARLARETRELRSQLTSLQNALTDDDGRVLGKLRDLLEERQLSEAPYCCGCWEKEKCKPDCWLSAAIDQVDWIELEVRRPRELRERP